jgi:anthranilate 1,2-dioxygenase small subunit
MSATDNMEDNLVEVTDPSVRARIEDFLTDYVHAIDDGRVPEWPDFFTPDGFYQITNRDNYEAGLPIGIMQCQGQGMMKDRVKAMYEANVFEPHVYCHLLGRTRLQEETPTLYHARTNFQIIRTMQDGGQNIFATGKYIDVIAFDDAAPKLKDRRVVLDSRRVDILIVYPL